jgi:hypothetical protein
MPYPLQMSVDIRLSEDVSDEDHRKLYATAMNLYKTKYEKEGLSMVIDFEHGLVNFMNEASCQFADKKELFYFLENVGYELIHYSGVKGKVTVY